MRLTKDKISASIWMVRLLQLCLGAKKGASMLHLVTEFNEALAQMKKDGSLEQIIQNGQLLTTTASPTTTTAVGQKLLQWKASTLLPATHLSPHSYFKIQAINTLVLIWPQQGHKDQGFEIEITNPGFEPLVLFKQDKQMVSLLVCLTDARMKPSTSQNPTTKQIRFSVWKNSAPSASLWRPQG